MRLLLIILGIIFGLIAIKLSLEKVVIVHNDFGNNTTETIKRNANTGIGVIAATIISVACFISAGLQPRNGPPTKNAA